jgi:hypothetical protein
MNDFEVKISKGDNSGEFDRKVVKEMMKMVGGGTEEGYRELFKAMKFKVDHEGRFL